VRSDLGATLSVLDLTTGHRTEIRRSGFGCWGQFAATSPDTTTVAIGCSLAPAPRPRPPNVPFVEWIRHPDNPRSTDRRNVMVLIAVPSLAVSLLGGDFDDSASRPAWATTGKWFAFSIPFENRLAWAEREGKEINRVKFTGRAPRPLPLTPLYDATDLVGRGID
jgi:hypothetical protein